MLRLLWLPLCLVVASGTAHGVIEPASRPLYSSSREKLLDFFSEQTSLPSSIARNGEAWILVSLGPTRFDFFGMALPATRSNEFAQACDEGLGAAGYGNVTVAFSVERGMALVDTDKTSSRFGSSSAGVRFDLAALRKALAKRGFRASVVVQTRSYAQTTGLSGAVNGRGSWVYFDGTRAGRISTRESVSPFEFIAAIAAAFWPGTIVGLAILIASRLAKNERLTRDRRKGLYQSIVLGSLLPAIVLHLPLILWLYGSGVFHRVSDLWIGGPSATGLFGPAMMLGLGLAVVLARRTKHIEDELFERPPTSKAESAERSRADIKRFAMVLGILLPFVVGGLIGLHLYGEPRVLIMSLLVGTIASLFLSNMDRFKQGW